MSVMRDEVAVGRVATNLAVEARHWPVSWSAIWVGALAAVSMVLIFGLLGIALGAYSGVPARGYPSWREFGVGSMVMSVLGAFLAFAVGGWVAGKIVGGGRAEVTMLHAGIAWLVAVPLLLGFTAVGSGVYFGSWYAGTRRRAAVGGSASRDGVAGGDPHRAGRRHRGADRAPAGPRGRGDRGLDGLRRADDPHLLPHAGPRPPVSRDGLTCTDGQQRRRHHAADPDVATRRSSEPDRDPVPARRGSLGPPAGMDVLDLFQDAVLVIIVLVAWGIAAWITGAILAAWVATQVGRDPVAWVVLALFLSPAVALLALAGLPALPAAEAEAPALGELQDRRLRAVSSL